MKYLINIGITIFTVAILYFYTPLTWLNNINTFLHGRILGTTLTSLNSSNLLSDFPTTYNANLTAINAGKMEVSTTSVDSITTLSNLTSVGSITSISSLTTIGTIVSGTWTADPIGVAYGGTGTTSPTAKQIMFGNGSLGFQVIGFGTSGQALISGGNATLPSWGAVGVDTTSNYSWTGNNYFKNLNASSTVANPMYLNGLSYSLPSVRAASSTCLMENGSGGLVFSSCDKVLFAGFNSNSAGASGATTTSMSLTIPANTLTPSNTLVGDVTFNYVGYGAGDVGCSVDFGTGSATTSISYETLGNGHSKHRFMITATSTTAQQVWSDSYRGNQTLIGVGGFYKATQTQGAFFLGYNAAAALYLDFVCNGAGGSTAKVDNGYVKIITK